MDVLENLAEVHASPSCKKTKYAKSKAETIMSCTSGHCSEAAD